MYLLSSRRARAPLDLPYPSGSNGVAVAASQRHRIVRHVPTRRTAFAVEQIPRRDDDDVHHPVRRRSAFTPRYQRKAAA